MAKPTFTDEFKQGVVQYVLDHPDESKLSIAKRFDIADSTVHKWVKDADKNNGTIAVSYTHLSGFSKYDPINSSI